MKLFAKRWLLLGAGAAVTLITLFFLLGPDNSEEDIVVEVTKDKLKIEVVTSGELEAKESEKIMGPRTMRSVGVWNVKITDLVDEGSFVKQGDYIATLDRSEVANKMKEFAAGVDKAESQFLAARLDTALSLRESRDQLINLKYTFEEKEIVLKQSKYESPAIIRQAEIDLEKAKRSFEQSKENYKLKLKQAKAKVSEKAAELRSEEIKLERAQKVIDEFTIKAPKDGMLVYHRDWEGAKVKVGSQISSWDPIVATLPDLSKMVSKTYVNEIDISKINKGQEVSIGVDAFPDKLFTGKIISVANVGEQLPNSDAKVFEVIIALNESDSILRPAMTTSNNILINESKETLQIPIEAVYSNDSLSYVMVKEGLGVKRKEIRTGISNDRVIEIKEGLEESDKVLLNHLKDAETYPLIAL